MNKMTWMGQEYIPYFLKLNLRKLFQGELSFLPFLSHKCGLTILMRRGVTGNDSDLNQLFCSNLVAL